MSLFQQLRWLYRPDKFLLEDYHTEIVAQVLRNDSDLMLQWLQGLGVTSLANADFIQINTQEEFVKLAGHSTASRPDITIRLVSKGKTELVFIESKLPSIQGDDQLQRYADHLRRAKARKAADHAALVFITRDYEAAVIEESVKAENGITFICTRWFHFYKCLKAHLNGDGLAIELKLFMEENRMSLGNQFRSTDLVALENFFSAKALMDETLEGEVSERIKTIFDGLYAVRRSVTYFRDDHRYAASNPNWNVIECHVGYWLPHTNPDDPVWVGVGLYSNPSAPNREDVIKAFRDWLDKGGNGWWGEEMDDKWAKSCICKGQSLQAFMGGVDHVRTIKDYLLALLNDVETFLKLHPNLLSSVEASGPTMEEKEMDD